MHRRRWIRAAVAVCVVAAMAIALRPRPRPNLLVITLDTTRADRLGCYGCATANTPALDSLAASGVLCEEAYSVAPVTLAAHASLFTGLYPPETGVRTNGRGRLDGSVPTLARQLSNCGYDTAAFVAAFVLDRKFGVDQGFQVYDDLFAPDQPGAALFERRRPGDQVVDSALAWLQIKRSRPFFLWVHLFDPHRPYVHQARAPGDEQSTQPYDDEIAFADRQVARLLDYLRDNRLAEQTLVVVAGDHGEGLGEHGESTHSMTLYNSTLRVPLIWSWPGKLPAGRRLKSGVSLVDVHSTILDELQVRPSREAPRPSLHAALCGSPFDAPPCYAATDEPFLQNGWSPLRALVVDRWKFIRSTRPELYDLQTDPGELNNVAESNPGDRQRMERQLADFEARMRAGPDVGVQLSAAERRGLASLGYVAGNRAWPAPAAPSLPDVKDMLALDAVLDDARRLAERGSLDAAILRLREVVRKTPSHADASRALADLLIRNSELDEAAATYLDLLDAKSDARGAHSGLANVLAAQGKFADAAAEYAAELEVDPLSIEAHYQLARMSIGGQNPRRALLHLDALLEIDAACAIAYKARAEIFAGMNQTADAITDFRSALKFNPVDPESEYHLGILLSDRDLVEARRRMEHAVELVPESAEYRFALGTLLLRQRRFPLAVEQLTRALELKPDSPSIAERLQRAQEGLHGTER